MTSAPEGEERAADITLSLSNCEYDLCGFVKQEIQDLKQEIQTFKEECFAKQDHTARVLESWDIHLRADGKNSSRGNNTLVDAGQTALEVEDVLDATGHHATLPANGAKATQLLETQLAESPAGPPRDGPAEMVNHGFHRSNQTWADLEALDDMDQCAFYTEVIANSQRSGVWRQILDAIGQSDTYLPQAMPDTRLARITQHPIFTTLTTLAILANTCIMGFETDASIKAVLQRPKGEMPSWVTPCNRIFNIIFTVELAYRMIALRSWFWLCPSWGWNLFDFFVVLSSLVSDAVEGMNFTFIRMFRILRAIRVVRLVRVLRIFRELRKMLFAILACLASLFWTFVFLTLTIFIFSILLLQGVTQALNDMGETSQEYFTAYSEVVEWYPTLTDTMFSLLVAATGGQDWLEVRNPLRHAGFIYTSAFLLYIIFVTVGVMNVLTGVFLSSADDLQDLSQVVQNHEIKLENFVRDMIELFKEMDVDSQGEVDWDGFSACIKKPVLQAYFVAHDLDIRHSHLLFDLLADGTGKIDLNRLVMGTLRLKGDAKAVDTLIIRRQVDELSKDVKRMYPSLTLI